MCTVQLKRRMVYIVRLYNNTQWSPVPIFLTLEFSHLLITRTKTLPSLPPLNRTMQFYAQVLSELRDAASNPFSFPLGSSKTWESPVKRSKPEPKRQFRCSEKDCNKPFTCPRKNTLSHQIDNTTVFLSFSLSSLLT